MRSLCIRNFNLTFRFYLIVLYISKVNFLVKAVLFSPYLPFVCIATLGKAIGFL
jgi:hypothetical protein